MCHVVHSCVNCKEVEGVPYSVACSPDLPNFRVSENPFTHTGLDFVGPLFIQDKKSNELQNAYICLFTCASTHGIHLELTDSLEVRSLYADSLPGMACLLPLFLTIPRALRLQLTK